MKKIRESLAYKNCKARPLRSAGLAFLAFCLTLTLFVGILLTGALRRGLASLKDRMGADIMVVPYEAVTKQSMDNMFLQGNMGYYYMDSARYEQIAALEGVGQVSAQFFLASTSSSCCSIPVQIVGIDPATDFTVMPWIKRSYGGELADYEVVVGNDLNAFIGDTLTFYGVDVRVAAKLDRTGTTMDTAVYTNVNTIRALIRSSLEKHMNTFADIDPDRVVSCVLLNVNGERSIEEVSYDINQHVRKVQAVQTKSMISGITGSLGGVSRVITLFAVLLSGIALIVLVAAFLISVSGRRKELALLRAIGASEGMVRRMILAEGFIVSGCGSLLGVALGCLLTLPFENLIETQLGLPFLLPGALKVCVLAALTLAAGVAAGALAATIAAGRSVTGEAGAALREAA